MKNSYLDNFHNRFFNIEENKDMKEIIDQVNNTFDSLITKFLEIESEMINRPNEEDDFTDIVIISLIRKIIEQLDAINVLYSVCSFEPAQIILRSLIENIVGLEFILKEDTKKRAAAYFLEHHHQEISRGKTYFNEKSKYGKLIIAQKGKDEFNIVRENYKKKKEAFNHLIGTNAIFQEISESRKTKLHNKKQLNKGKKAFIQWYEVCSDVTTFYGLMKEIGYKDYYNAIYCGLSFESHGLNSAMGICANEKEIAIKPIRNPEDGGTTFELTCIFSIKALHKIYQYLWDNKKDKKTEFNNFFEDIEKSYKTIGFFLDAI